MEEHGGVENVEAGTSPEVTTPTNVAPASRQHVWRWKQLKGGEPTERRWQ